MRDFQYYTSTSSAKVKINFLHGKKFQFHKCFSWVTRNSFGRCMDVSKLKSRMTWCFFPSSDHHTHWFTTNVCTVHSNKLVFHYSILPLIYQKLSVRIFVPQSTIRHTHTHPLNCLFTCDENSTLYERHCIAAIAFLLHSNKYTKK